jgi:hypothetical protein
LAAFLLLKNEGDNRMSTCTAPDCDNPTDLYICGACVEELAVTLAAIPDMLPVLAMIGRKEEQPFTTRVSRMGGKAGPTTPLNFQAIALGQILNSASERTAAEYAHDPDAAHLKDWIGQQVEQARQMVYGENEQTTTTDYINYRMKQVLPMTIPTLVPWLHETMRINLRPSRIHKWAQRGHITRTNNHGDPTYHPADVLRAYHETRSRI